MIKRKLLAADEPSKKQPRRDEASSDEEESAQHTTSQGRMPICEVVVTRHGLDVSEKTCIAFYMDTWVLCVLGCLCKVM